MPTRLTDQIITAAILGFEEQKRHINLQISELRAMLPSGSDERTTPEPPTRKGDKFSPKRQNLNAAQQRRWATIKGNIRAAVSSHVQTSEEGMKRIIAASKKR